MGLLGKIRTREERKHSCTRMINQHEGWIKCLQIKFNVFTSINLNRLQGLIKLQHQLGGPQCFPQGFPWGGPQVKPWQEILEFLSD